MTIGEDRNKADLRELDKLSFAVFKSSLQCITAYSWHTLVPGFSGRPPRAVNRKIDTLGK